MSGFFDSAALDVEIQERIATIRLASFAQAIESGGDVHEDLGLAIDALRRAPDVRVIVVTGRQDGEFLTAGPSEMYPAQEVPSRLREPLSVARLIEGIIHTHWTMAQTPKPIVSRVNGDAIGFGQSIMMACDLIIAREDARISDLHLGMGEIRRSDGVVVGTSYGVAPGDGAGALVSSFLSPTKAKEYLMLPTVQTARDLAALGVVNRAVPMRELDDAVDDVVSGLLRRPATSLAWSKRLVNRRLLENMNGTVEAAAAFEMLDFQFLSRHPVA